MTNLKVIEGGKSPKLPEAREMLRLMETALAWLKWRKDWGVPLGGVEEDLVEAIMDANGGWDDGESG